MRGARQEDSFSDCTCVSLCAKKHARRRVDLCHGCVLCSLTCIYYKDIAIPQNGLQRCTAFSVLLLHVPPLSVHKSVGLIGGNIEQFAREHSEELMLLLVIRLVFVRPFFKKYFYAASLANEV